MSAITKDAVLRALEEVMVPETGNDVVSSNIISSVLVDGGNVGVVLEVKSNSDFQKTDVIRKLCEKRLGKIDGVEKITAVITSESGKAGSVKVDAKSAPKGGTRTPTPKPIEGIKKIIAVGSGKGGVGKSTMAVNIAVALGKAGYKTGIVDADIYGPSVARMMGLKGEPEVKNNMMVPPENHGIKCMSMGLILGENVPVVWRGPMISKALQQLMLGAAWGELDFLVIDLPPGTGDIHLSLAQNFKIDGIVMVSTPQEIAIMDVKKAIGMFDKVDVPILGVIENMSYFEDVNTGTKSYPFGKGKVEIMCKELGVRYLGEVPVLATISEKSDSGAPFILEDNKSSAAKNIKTVSEVIAKQFAKN